MKISNRTSVVVVAAAAATVMASGLAYAYWSTTGFGTASAQAGTAQPLTATVAAVSASGATGIVPGVVGTPAYYNVAVNVHNPNTFPVTVNHLIVTGVADIVPTVATTPIPKGACTGATSLLVLKPGTYNLATGTPANPSTVNAGDSVILTTTAAGSTRPLWFDANSADGCQNAQFNFAGAAVTVD